MSYEINKILIPVDFSETSENAVLEGILIAELCRAEVCLVHVIEQKYYFPAPADLMMWSTPETVWIPPTEEDLDNLVKKKMSEMEASLRTRTQINLSTAVLNGNMPEQITDFAVKHHFDLVIMGTHGSSGYKELFLGSNAQRVVTLSKIPVLTLRRNGPSFEQILLPIDNAMHSREKVKIAVQIAKLYKSKVHIIGLPDSDEQVELNKFRIKLDSMEKIFQAEHLPYQTTMLKSGNLAEATLRYAKENKCDLIIINTGHESAMTGIFLGAFAQQIVNHSPVPVLSIRPHDDKYDISAPGYAI
jgi:nucleotide-binding universal stress UspA family protein